MRVNQQNIRTFAVTRVHFNETPSKVIMFGHATDWAHDTLDLIEELTKPVTYWRLVGVVIGVYARHF